MSLLKKIKKGAKKVAKGVRRGVRVAKAVAPLAEQVSSVVFPAQTLATKARIADFKTKIAPIRSAIGQTRGTLRRGSIPPPALPPANRLLRPQGPQTGLARVGTPRMIIPSGRVQNMSLLSGVGRILPGVGSLVGGAAAGAAGGAVAEVLADGTMRPKRRRRRRGFTPRDISQAKRLMKMLKDVQRACPAPRSSGGRRSPPQVICK